MTLHMVNSTQPVESRGEEVDTALTLLALGGGGDRQQERQQQSLRRDDTTGHVMQVEHTKPTVACTESSPMRVIHRSMSVDLSQTSYPRLAPVLYSHPYHPSGSHLETFEMTRSNPSPQYVPVIRSGRRRASIDSYQYHQDEALRRSSLGRFVSPRIAYVSDRDLDNFWHYDRNSTDQQYRTPPASLVLVTHERPTHLISHPAEIEAEQRQLHHYVPVPIPPPADVMLRHYDNEVDSHHQRMVFKQQYNHFHPSIESSPTVWHQAVRHDDTSESTAAAEREKKMTLPSSSDKRSGGAEAVKQKDRQVVTVGSRCSAEERKKKIARYLEKKKRRAWSKKVTYRIRKSFADSRLRVKGRFITKVEESKHQKMQVEENEDANTNRGTSSGDDGGVLSVVLHNNHTSSRRHMPDASRRRISDDEETDNNSNHYFAEAYPPAQTSTHLSKNLFIIDDASSEDADDIAAIDDGRNDKGTADATLDDSQHLRHQVENSKSGGTSSPPKQQQLLNNLVPTCQHHLQEHHHHQ